MLAIDAETVGARMDPLHLVAALRAGHEPGTMGLVERMLLEQPGPAGNAALTWAGWEPDLGLAVKTATSFSGNSRTGRPNVQSVVVLFEGTHGTPLAAIHGARFTRMKTAADSALAADLLARPDADTLAILGAGGQAETQIRFLCAVRPSIRRVRIWNRSPESGLRLAAALTASGLPGEAVPDAEAAVRGAAIVSCLTGALSPVLQGAWLAPGTHVDLVGGYTPTMRESDDEVIRRGRLFADSRAFGITTCGDYAVPIAAGLITPASILGDLFDLCAHRVAGRRSMAEITVCKNGGGGHLDLMAARAFYAAATRP